MFQRVEMSFLILSPRATLFLIHPHIILLLLLDARPSLQAESSSHFNISCLYYNINRVYTGCILRLYCACTLFGLQVQVISWSLLQPAYLLYLTPTQSGTTWAASEQPIVSMETEAALRLLTTLLIFATQKLNLRPGLASTTAPESPSRKLRSSPETDAVGRQLEMLTSALQMSFQLLPVRCSLAAAYLAITLDLPLMDNS